MSSNHDDIMRGGEMGRGNSAVLFWGVHRRRETCNKADKRTIVKLSQLVSHLTLVLADEHGWFNEIDNPLYLSEVNRIAQEHGCNTLYLSYLYQSWGLSSSPQIEAINLAKELMRNNSALNSSLLRGANNRGQGQEEATRYAALRLSEAPHVAKLVKHGTLLVIGEPEISPLFPGVGNIAFVRAMAKTGQKPINQAPWIQ